MSENERYYAKFIEYPDGSYDIIASNRKVFGPKSKKAKNEPLWDENTTTFEQKSLFDEEKPQEKKERKKNCQDLERAKSRAKANVRRLALCNDFRWFVTLTIDPKKIDSYDAAAVVRRMNQWLSNHVRRNGLKYVLVPERHKSGRIHFHGFFNDVVEVKPSNKMDSSGHPIFNLPEWDYGFTTAIELYGDYHAAVGYTCKYIGKEVEKIGGRWYYSGGNLQKPVEKFVDISLAELMEMQNEEFTAQYGQGWQKGTPGGIFAGVNGLR